MSVGVTQTSKICLIDSTASCRNNVILFLQAAETMSYCLNNAKYIVTNVLKMIICFRCLIAYLYRF